MEIIHVKTPTDYTWCDEDSELSSECALDSVLNAGADLIIYWYAAGNYEGDGQALIRKDNRWQLEHLAHCSCYGPLESFSWDGDRAQSLKDLKACCSEDLLEMTDTLFEEAEKYEPQGI